MGSGYQLISIVSVENCAQRMQISESGVINGQSQSQCAYGPTNPHGMRCLWFLLNKSAYRTSCMGQVSDSNVINSYRWMS